MKRQTKAPAAISHVQIERNKARLESRVFVHSGSKADKVFFRNEIHKWLLTNQAERTPFNTMLEQLVFKRNTGGAKLKYMYFNANAQRTYLLKDFISWAENTRTEIYNQLKKYYA